MIKFLRKTPAVWVILVWTLAVLPSLPVRSFIWEEGTNAELARDMLVHGNMLEPSIYGVRWAEKPSLVPWLIVGVARLTGEVNEWSARLPAMLAVLVTALLVLSLARRPASTPAAFFAAACFLFCPLLLRKLTIAEPDTIITALSFGALVIWWRGAQARVSWRRWLACGMLLTTAAMAKGPQPIAYFALGVGGFIVLHKRWGDLPGLMLSLVMPAIAVVAWAIAVYRPGDLTVWLGYMRLGHRIEPVAYLVERVRFSGVLMLDLLPATLLLPFMVHQWQERRLGEKSTLINAMFCYAGMATLVLFLWPGANTRYAMQAAPACAVIAGLAIDDLWQRCRVVSRFAAILLAALFAYQLVLVTVVMPMFPHSFGATRIAGQAIDQAIGRAPAPAFNIDGPDTNQLFYVSHPIHGLDLRDAMKVAPPAWLLLAPHKLSWIEAQNPDFAVSQLISTTSGVELVAARIGSRPAP
ncbi:MAG: ArnT family glycosyltransferase [Syntrophobacteraceae bacterium]